MSLLNILKSNLDKPAAQPAQTELGQTGTIRNLLQAKSGKQVSSGSAPSQSSLGENLAANQANLAVDQVNDTGRLQDAQQDQRSLDITQQGTQDASQREQSFKAMQSDLAAKTNNLLQDYERGGKQIQGQQDQFKNEQLGFGVRLQNDQYINQLQDVGAKLRLDNDRQFKEQLYKQTFADQADLFKSDFDFKRLMDVNERDFVNELANMDIDYAMEVANSSAKAQNAQNVATGAGNIISGGVQAAGMFQANKTSTPAGNANSTFTPATTGDTSRSSGVVPQGI